MIVQPMVLTKLRPMLPPLGAAVDVNVDLTVEFAIEVVVGLVAKAAVGFAAAETAVGLASELAGFAVGSADVGCCEVSCGLQGPPVCGGQKNMSNFFILCFLFFTQENILFSLENVI